MMVVVDMECVLYPLMTLVRNKCFVCLPGGGGWLGLVNCLFVRLWTRCSNLICMMVHIWRFHWPLWPPPPLGGWWSASVIQLDSLSIHWQGKLTAIDYIHHAHIGQGSKRTNETRALARFDHSLDHDFRDNFPNYAQAWMMPEWFK